MGAMKDEKKTMEFVPEHYTGKIIDTESFVEFNSAAEARSLFEVAKNRLLNVNSWNELTGTATAEFQVVDKDGMEVDRPVQEGDYFKIDVPGPGPVAGDGYDWVRVEEISVVAEPETESVGVRVRPCPNPQTREDDAAVHFYSEESTSNFLVAREGNIVKAGVYDRNTKPNDEGDLVDKARNLLMGLGAVEGFSRFQWKQLTDGLLGE
jgi:hypothetical protein